MSSFAAIAANVRDCFLAAALTLKPPPKLTITEWAEQNIVLSSEDSAEAGTHYRATRAPYQRGMQDAILAPGVEVVVFFMSAQVGKTLILKNILAYFIKEDPSSILWMVPTLDLAKKVSTQRIAPMFRDVPCLRDLLEVGSRKHGNSILERSFPGGVLFMVGANSPASLSSMPIRIVLCDEVDRYEASAGAEGDPIALAAKRQTTFQGFRKRIVASTPTLKGESRIEAQYEDTDQRKLYVPCLHCGAMQLLDYKRLVAPPGEPTIENTVYACGECGAAHSEFDKHTMLLRGDWVAKYPDRKDRIGFWLNEVYSPFVTWAEMLKEGRRVYANRLTDPESYKVWVNTALGESYEEKDEDVDLEGLQKRCESYTLEALPDGVSLLTAGIDLQEDRIEVEVVGWGRKFESWSIDRQVYFDDAKPEGDDAGDDVLHGDRHTKWEKLDKYLETTFLHSRGVRLPIEIAFIDSGYDTLTVYRWVKTRRDRGIYASKGANRWEAPPLAKPKRTDRINVKLYTIGVSQIKVELSRWLKLDVKGPGYMHFSSRHNDADYFAQLTAEHVEKTYKHGFPVRTWVKAEGARNEALDCRVYAYAALLALSEKPDLKIEAYRERLLEQARHLADLRKKGEHPDQLTLLPAGDAPLVDPDAPDDFEELPPAPRAIAAAASVSPAPAPPVIAQTDAGKSAIVSEPPNKKTKPQVRFRRSGW